MNIEVDEGNRNFADYDGALYDSECKKLIFVPKKATSIEFHPNTERILSEAFYLCSEIDSVTIPNSIKYIGKRAFAYSSLSTILFDEGGNSSLEIDVSAFEGTSITSLAIPIRTNNIKEKILYNCKNLKHLTIPFIGKSYNENDGEESSKFNHIFGIESMYSSYEYPTKLEEVKVLSGKIPAEAFYDWHGIKRIILPNEAT